MQKEIYFFMTQKKTDIFHDNDNGVHIKKMLILETKENNFKLRNINLEIKT